MINQLQRHIVIALWAKQRIFAETVKETLLKRLGRQNSVASGVGRCVGRDDLGQAFSGFLVAYIAVEAVISDSVKSFWQDVLDHSSHELECRESFMFDLFCFVISIPVADRIAVIVFDASDRDRGGNDIFCQILSQPLSPWWYISGLKISDKTFGVIFPCLVNVWFNRRIGNLFSEHFEKMILPFFVHYLVRNIGDIFPMFQRINSTGGHEDMKMGIVMAGSPGSLENNDGSYIEFFPGVSLDNVFEAGMSSPYQGTEQCGVTKEPGSQKLWHRQDYMAVSNARQKAPSDEISPAVGINCGARQAKAGFAGKGNATRFSALAASILDKAHFFRIAAVEHFLYRVIVIGTIKAWSELLKRLPVIIENLFERVFVNIFTHDKRFPYYYHDI